MRALVVALSVALLLPTAAQAEWFKVGTSDSNSIWYMDPERVKADGAKVQAWVRVDASHDKTLKWSEAKELLGFDCSAQTYKLLSVVTYDSYGKIIDSKSSPDYGYGIGYEPVVPDTMGEAVEKLACLSARQ